MKEKVNMNNCNTEKIEENRLSKKLNPVELSSKEVELDSRSNNSCNSNEIVVLVIELKF